MPLLPGPRHSLKSLHLIQHSGQSRLHFESLLYLVSGDERILTIFEKARALMFAHEPNERWRVRFPIWREALKVLEDCIDAGLFKESDCIFGIFIKVSIEYALVHEIRISTDLEKDPSQVVELERGENERIASYGAFYFFFFPYARITSSHPALILAIIVKTKLAR